MKPFKILTALLVLGLLVGCSADESVARKTDYAAETASSPAGSADMAAPAEYRNVSSGSISETEIDTAELLKNRHVIRKATIEVKVEDVESADMAAQKLVESMGGFVASGNTAELGTAHPTVTMTVRVPVAKFEETLNALGDMGVLLSKSISSDDVTGQVVDMDARLKTLRAKEEVFVGMLRKAKSTSDMVELQNSITNTRTEIERIEGQRRTLAGQAQFSTISLTLTQETSSLPLEKDQNWSAMAWTESGSAFGGLVRALGTIGIWLLTFAPVWLPMMVLLGLGIRWAQKSGQATGSGS